MDFPQCGEVKRAHERWSSVKAKFSQPSVWDQWWGGSSPLYTQVAKGDTNVLIIMESVYLFVLY